MPGLPGQSSSSGLLARSVDGTLGRQGSVVQRKGNGHSHGTDQGGGHQEIPAIRHGLKLTLLGLLMLLLLLLVVVPPQPELSCNHGIQP